jgi:hypothetical protein
MYGEMQMKALAREMGEEGDYVVLVGTLTTPGHNSWAARALHGLGGHLHVEGHEADHVDLLGDQVVDELDLQDGKTWDLELISAKNYGEMQMKALAREMGEEGDYVLGADQLEVPGLAVLVLAFLRDDDDAGVARALHGRLRRPGRHADDPGPQLMGRCRHRLPEGALPQDADIETMPRTSG